MRAVRPEALENTKLPEALAEIAARWSTVNGVAATVTTTGTAQALHPEVEVTLLRVAQEALANVAKHAGASRAWITLSYMDDVVTLDVRDDGAGFRIPGPGAPGGGFGLTTMRQRVQRLAGHLEIESEPGGGTAISARVPAILRETPPSVSSAAPSPTAPAGGWPVPERGPQPSPGRVRLLIVDDHPVVRDGLRGILEGSPEFEVVGEAGNGAEAVTRARALRPDVVLMDLRMPDVDGVTAIKRLAELGIDARVLVLTTFDTDSDVVPAIEAGATGYLLKDSPRSELLRAVRAAARGEAVLSPRWPPGCSARCARRPGNR